MPVLNAAYWSELLHRTLPLYEEELLRQVASRLLKPRGHWPVDELLRRIEEAMSNAPVIDRRLKELPPACRQLLALIGHSRQPRWRVGALVELITSLGHDNGLEVILQLLTSGLLFPDLTFDPTAPLTAATQFRDRCQAFESWLSLTAPARLVVFSHPDITRRVLSEALGLPDLSQDRNSSAKPAALREADGLEWPLRLSILRQQAHTSPFRLTQQGDLFKRDLDRLENNSLLSSQPADSLLETPDIGLLALALGRAEGVVHEREGEIQAGVMPSVWSEGLPETLASLWAGLPWLDRWNAFQGSRTLEDAGQPYASAALLALLLLRSLPAESWCPVKAIPEWLRTHHPFWRSARPSEPPEADSTGTSRFLLTLAYQLRLVQAAKDSEGHWLVRLSGLGRWLLGLGERPALAGFPKTLLVQPNLEILLYRQGLTPELIARLGQFAAWKGLGAACNLQLEPETVYTALEAGESFAGILLALEQHGMKPTPGPVVDMLRTWAQKRERITVYPAATILEFPTPADLTDALARGVPLVRVSDRMALIAREADIDYRHFRLTANRDYTLPPEPCVRVAEDGVTLHVDLNRSDLLLETEIHRFAREAVAEESGQVRTFHLTPASLADGQKHGLTVEALEAWFLHRTGEPLSPAARLLLTAQQQPTPRLRLLLVLQVDSEDIADGLCQWPETSRLIEERLGPTALAISADNLPALQACLAQLEVILPVLPPANSTPPKPL